MFKKALPIFIHTLTPLHAGSGDSLGAVDMPIQRERHTEYPKIEGSGLKGSIREIFTQKQNGNDITTKSINIVFGPDESGEDHASSIGFTDARILLFPVKSVKDVFAWIISSEVIIKLKNDLDLVFTNNFEQNQLNFTKEDVKNLPVPNVPEGESLTTNDSTVFINSGGDKYTVMEEYSYKTNTSEECSKIAKFLCDKLKLPEEIKQKLVILNKNDFRDFTVMSTEIITRTRISSETGTVEQGALFNEEYLPTEAIMYSMVLASAPLKDENKNKTEIKTHNDVMNFFIANIPNIIQIGGNATIGKGLVKIIKGVKNNG